MIMREEAHEGRIKLNMLEKIEGNMKRAAELASYH